MPKQHQSTRRTSTWPKTKKTLCKVCNNLDAKGHAASFYDAESSSSRNARLTLTVDALRLRKSRDWCRYCRVLTDSLDPFLPAWSTMRSPISVELCLNTPIYIAISDGKHGRSMVEVYNIPGTRSPWPTIGTASKIASEADSDACFQFARQCLDDCISKHPACQETLNGRPRRLLFVGSSGNSIRLVENDQKGIKYAALSHCWGSQPGLTTTLMNIESYRLNLGLDSLPALFRDAVTITRNLGIEHLWIDALCIIQDSRSDWALESANMQNIYRSAHFTISAVQACDSNARILLPRTRPAIVEYENTAGKKTYLRARKVVPHHPDQTERRPAKPDGPLMSRAWVLQEHLLSPRVIHYTSTELIFECRRICRCECTQIWRSCITTPSYLHNLSPKQTWPTWQRIVSQYTLRSLSFPSDKLPAVSGIAAHFQTFLADRNAVYLAGLWLPNLVSDMLWSSSPSLQSPISAPRYAAYRAPSFSWASVDTQIQYRESDDDSPTFSSTVNILEASCTPSTASNMFGEVSSGFLRLKGLIAKGTLSTLESVDYECALQLRLPGSSGAVDVAPDSLLVPSSPTHDGSSVSSVRRAGPRDEYCAFAKAEVWCMSVASYGHEYISGLVLVPASGPNDQRAFERVGTFECGFEWFTGAAKEVITII